MLIVVVRVTDLNHRAAGVGVVRRRWGSACRGWSGDARGCRTPRCTRTRRTAARHREGQVRRLTSSFFSVAKNVSATALSYASAGAHRDRDPCLAGGAPERQTDVLAALVGMVDQPAPWTPARERHLEGVDDERRAHVGRHRPADDQPGVGVLHRGEVQPALAGAQVGDVSNPQHVRPRRREVTLDQIGGRCDPRDPNRRLPPLLGLTPAIPAAFINRATRF